MFYSSLFILSQGSLFTGEVYNSTLEGWKGRVHGGFGFAKTKNMAVCR